MKTALIAIVVSLVTFFAVYMYMPLSWLESVDETRFGSTITTILGTDTLSASRAVINTNFSNLNTDKIEATVSALTSLAQVGTITVGTWNATAIPVLYGGTGTTSPSLNQVIVGSTTDGFKVIGYGTSGQFLTSGGAAVAPSWTTASINEAGTYNWTGIHDFAKSTTTNATTTGTLSIGSFLTLNGVKLRFGTTGPSASSTILSFSANGLGSFNHPPQLVGDGTPYGSTSNASTTVYFYTIPAGMLSVTDGIRVSATMLSTSNGEKAWDIAFGNGTATSSLISRGRDDGAANSVHTAEAEFFNANSATTQWGSARFYISSGTTFTSSTTATSWDTAAKTYISFNTRNVANDSDSVQYVGISVQKLTQ